MSLPSPSEITTRSEHTGLANAGEMGTNCVPCAKALRVQYIYDDRLRTPITDLEVRLADASGAPIVDSIMTEAPANLGREDATPGLGAQKAELGGVTRADVPLAAGVVESSTNPSEDIESLSDEIARMSGEIADSLAAFEADMKIKFQPYIDEWQEEGALGAVGDYYSGVLAGATAWWEGEKDFWGSAYGALKSSVAAIDAYSRQANAEGLPTWIPNASAINLLTKAGRDLFGAAEEAGVFEFLESLTKLIRAFVKGDIDAVITELEELTGLEDLPGAIGEFGLMLKDALADGVDWIRDMIELLRSSSVVNLMLNTAMRCIMMMTPNFWAKIIGQTVGFIIPEILIALIGMLISALSAGAGAVVLAERAARISRTIIAGFKTGQHVSKIVDFLKGIRPIFNKVGELATKLRRRLQPTPRTGDGPPRLNRPDPEPPRIVTPQPVVVATRQYLERLARLAREGHGPQRHEGDVTDIQLLNRVTKRFDPMTDSIVDAPGFKKKYGVDYDPNRHGVPDDFLGPGVKLTAPDGNEKLLEMSNAIRHPQAPYATKINTPVDYVDAYDAIKDSPGYDAFVASGKKRDAVPMRAGDIFEGDLNVRFKGYDRAGNPVHFGPDTNMIAVFTNNDGVIKLLTMYPDP